MERNMFIAFIRRASRADTTWRKLLLGLCAAVVVLSGLIASASVSAKDVGPSITIPESARVQLLYKGHFIAKVEGGHGLSGTFDCVCAGGGGTCEVTSIAGENERFLVCERGKTGTCKSRCGMTTTTTTISPK